MDFKYIKIEILIKEGFCKENSKAKDNLNGLQDKFIKVNGNVDLSEEKEFLMDQEIKNISDNLTIISQMERDYINLIMEINIKVNGNKV